MLNIDLEEAKGLFFYCIMVAEEATAMYGYIINYITDKAHATE